MNQLKYCVLFMLLSNAASVSWGQQKAINWLTFEQLQDSLEVKPKKVYIDFYADWCAYCKKMDEVAYKDPTVVTILNNDYYAVKMNAESTEKIQFDGQLFTNQQFGENRHPLHEIPLLLASREGLPFSLPAIVILDASFVVTKRYFEYLSTKVLRDILKDTE